MKKEFRVILDADDTLYECNRTAIKLLNDEKGTEYSINDIKNWGILGNELDERLKFFNDPTFIKNIPLMKGAKDFVHKLSEKAEIFICTNVQPQCAVSRFFSLTENFPEIKPENIIIGGRKDLLVADMMLDDAIHNLDNAKVMYPVLFQQPWNFENCNILSVAGYDEFLELVEVIKNSSTYNNTTPKEMVSLIGPSGSGKNQLADNLCKNERFEKVKAYSTNPYNTGSYQYISKNDFIAAKENGFFSETSIYMGNYYGIRKEDIDCILLRGKIPVMVLDINGAMSIGCMYNSLNVFVKATKSQCITKILSYGNLSNEQKAQRIIALDSETKNENLCDCSFYTTDDEKIIEMFK